MLHSKLKNFVEKKDGTFLVVGAPGTGKTHVLLELVSYLLREKNIAPDRILVFSFNRRWAKILREKTSEDRGESLVEIPITSFFAYCAELIEKNLFLKNPGNHISLPGECGNNEHFKNAISDNPEEEAQYSGLKILTAPDQWKLLKDVISGRLDKKNYPQTFRFMESSPHIYRSYIQEVFDFILRAQENLLTPKVLSNKFTPFYNRVLSEIVGIYVNYLQCLKDSGIYNYGRLLVDAAELLQNNMEFAGFCKKSYEFVIVDEFQEINRAQFEVVKNISNNNTILFGNDDECTYAFRGSMLNNFNSVYDELASGSGKLKNVLFLEKNYRSNYLINEACRQFIEINKDRVNKKSLIYISVDVKHSDEGKDLEVTKNSEDIKNLADIESSDSVRESDDVKDSYNDRNSDGAKDSENFKVSDDIREGAFETGEFKTVMDEITFICTRIKKLIFLKNIKPEKICIIVKGMGYKTRLLENMLSGSNIAFMRRSSRTILDNHFIKYILNFLKLIVLQTSPPENSGQIEIQLLLALLCSEPVGLRPVFVKKIFNRARPGSMLINIREFLRNNEALPKAGIKKKSAKTGKSSALFESLYLKDLERLSDFMAALEKYMQLNSSGATAGNLVDELVNDTRIGILKHLLGSKKNPDFVTINILSLLGDYLRTVNDFSESNPTANTADKYLLFLEDIISNNFLEEIEESTKEFLKPGLVNILSYHQCKGLEFDAGFLPFINENYLPSPFGRSQLYDMQIFNYFTEGKSYSEEILKTKHLADERKLFYTGLTRAKDYVFVTSCSSEAKSGFFEELEDIVGDVKKKMAPKNEKSITKLNKSKTFNKSKIINKSNALNKGKTPGVAKEGPENPARPDYKNQRLASLEKWLVRKRAISKVYKKNNRAASGRDTLTEDLIFLKEMYPPQSWWSIKKLSSNNNVPFRVLSPVFSYSALSSYLECPVKYKMNFYFKLKQEKNLSLLVGSIYHEILKNYFEKNKDLLSWPSLQKEITEVFAQEKFKSFEFAYLKKEVFEKAVEDFKNYYEDYVNGKTLKVSSERAFDFDIEGSKVKGRIDQINFISEEAVELIDFKSGKKNSAALNEENEIQLRLYRMAVDLSPGLKDIEGKEYSMKYIFLGDKKNRELSLDKNFYDFRQFYNFIKDTIKEIKMEKFGVGAKNTYICKSCDYRIVCNAKP